MTLQDGGVMIQAFAPEVCSEGEWSLVFFDKTFSHAVLKKPKAGDFRTQLSLGARVEPREPPPALVEQAERTLRAVRRPLLYARVDGVAVRSVLHLMELELIEPALYLGSGDGADRFADCIAGWVSKISSVSTRAM